MTRVAPETAALEADARDIRAASRALLDAEMFDRWGPTDDAVQREVIARAAASASERRRAAIARIERRVPELRAQQPALVEAWADAHLALLAEVLGRVPSDSTEAFVAREERDAWTRLRTGELDYVQQNTFYVHYDRTVYAEWFGFEPVGP